MNLRHVLSPQHTRRIPPVQYTTKSCVMAAQNGFVRSCDAEAATLKPNVVQRSVGAAASWAAVRQAEAAVGAARRHPVALAGILGLLLGLSLAWAIQPKSEIDLLDLMSRYRCRLHPGCCPGHTRHAASSRPLPSLPPLRSPMRSTTPHQVLTITLREARFT